MDDENKVAIAESIYNTLRQNDINCILDDRLDLSIGAKIKDCKVLGTPYMVVLGDKMNREELSIEDIKTGEITNLSNIDELINFFI